MGNKQLKPSGSLPPDAILEREESGVSATSKYSKASAASSNPLYERENSDTTRSLTATSSSRKVSTLESLDSANEIEQGPATFLPAKQEREEMELTEEELAVHEEITDLLAMYHIHHDILRFIGRELDLEDLSSWTLHRGFSQLNSLLERRYGETLTSFMQRLNLDDSRVDVTSGLWRLSDDYLLAGTLSKALPSSAKVFAELNNSTAQALPGKLQQPTQRDMPKVDQSIEDAVELPKNGALVNKDSKSSRSEEQIQLEKCGPGTTTTSPKLQSTTSRFPESCTLDRLVMQRRLAREKQAQDDDREQQLAIGLLDLEHVSSAESHWVVDSLRLELESFFCEYDPRGIHEDVFRYVMAYGINVGRRELERVLYFTYRQHLNDACGPLFLNPDEALLHKEKLEGILIVYYNKVDPQRITTSNNIGVEAVAEWALDSGMARLNTKLGKQYGEDLIDVLGSLDVQHSIPSEKKYGVPLDGNNYEGEKPAKFGLLGIRTSRIPASGMVHHIPGDEDEDNQSEFSQSIQFWRYVREQALYALEHPGKPLPTRRSGSASSSQDLERLNSARDTELKTFVPVKGHNAVPTASRLLQSVSAPSQAKSPYAARASTPFPSIAKSRAVFTNDSTEVSNHSAKAGSAVMAKVKHWQPNCANDKSIRDRPRQYSPLFAQQWSRKNQHRPNKPTTNGPGQVATAPGAALARYLERLKKSRMNTPKPTTIVRRDPPKASKANKLRDELESFLLREDPTKLVDSQSDLGFSSLYTIGLARGRDTLNRHLARHFNGRNLGIDSARLDGRPSNPTSKLNDNNEMNPNKVSTLAKKFEKPIASPAKLGNNGTQPQHSVLSLSRHFDKKVSPNR